MRLPAASSFKPRRTRLRITGNEPADPISSVFDAIRLDIDMTASDDLVLLPLPDLGQGTKTGQGSWAWAVTAPEEKQDAAHVSASSCTA